MESINFRILMSICNIITIFFLIRGVFAIKKRNRETHKKSMLSAIALSGVLIIFYLLDSFYHGPMKHNDPQGLFKFVLVSHIFLSAINPFTVLATTYFAIKGNFEIHKKMVKITLPIWIYVSATGIWIYLV